MAFRSPSDMRNLRSRASRRERRPVGIDLFAGVGGLSLGFEQAGFDVVAAVENDPVHAAVHAYNFPRSAVICADVCNLEAEAILNAARTGLEAHGYSSKHWDGEIDCIFGGPPCQGFSTMGKRDVRDRRNRLVYKFADLIGCIQPRYFLMENVPGMASGGHASILVKLIDHFERLKYTMVIPAGDFRAKAILNAADFGVPQDRRRLFILGARLGEKLPDYPSPTVESVPKRSQYRGNTRSKPHGLLLPTGPTVGEAILDLPNLDGFGELVGADEVLLSHAAIRSMTLKGSSYARRLRGELGDPEDLAYPRMWDHDLLTSSMRTKHALETIRRFIKTAPGETEAISRFYRLDEHGLCNTLRAGTGGDHGSYTSPRPIHPTLARVISVREAARLHSFPDWFRLHKTKWNGFRSIGNAVPPMMGRAIASQIVRALELRPHKHTEALKPLDSFLLSFGRLAAAMYFKKRGGQLTPPRLSG